MLRSQEVKVIVKVLACVARNLVLVWKERKGGREKGGGWILIMGQPGVKAVLHSRARTYSQKKIDTKGKGPPPRRSRNAVL